MAKAKLFIFNHRTDIIDRKGHYFYYINNQKVYVLTPCRDNLFVSEWDTGKVLRNSSTMTSKHTVYSHVYNMFTDFV